MWITPDPLAQEREILGGGKINVESLPDVSGLPGRILPPDYLGQRACAL